MISLSDKSTLADSVDDFSLRQVPESALQSTGDLTLVRMGFTVSASDLLFGFTIGLYFNFWSAIWIALGYSAIVSVVSILMGIIGLRERTTFALSSRFSFGTQGSKLPSFIIAAIIAGFYGYILGITVDVFPALTPVTLIIYSVILGIVFLVISGLGFKKGLKWVGRIGVPLMLLLVVVADILTVQHAGGFSAIVTAVPKQAGKLGLLTILGLGVSKWMGGATVTPDLLRFARNTKSVVISTIGEFIVGNFGFNLLGLILGLGLGIADLGKAFSLIGISALALLAIFIQSVTVEMNELYAASLALSNVAGIKRFTSNAIVGVIGIVIGYIGVSQGIVASFLTWIGYISYALPAIPGIIIADYFVVQKMHYPKGLEGLPAVNWRAIATYAVSIIISLYVGIYLHDVFWHSLPLISFVIYLLLSIPQIQRNWSSTSTSSMSK